MQVELHLVGSASRWRLTAPRTRIGRDPSCEVALSAESYAAVSREHAILTIESGKIHLIDNQSTNGIFVNGKQVSSAMLTKLDRFRLGQDGPEFEIQVMDEKPAAIAPTVLGAGAAGAPTVVGLADPGAAPTRIARSDELSPSAAVPTEVPQAQESRRSSPPSAARPAASGLPLEEQQMIERKLNLLKNLVYLLVAMVIVLFVVVFYQSQQIDKNRAALDDMRMEALRKFDPAVTEVEKTMNQRLDDMDNRMKARLDDVDKRMKDAEDEFMARLNKELPRMLNNYVEQAMKRVGQALPRVTQPDER